MASVRQLKKEIEFLSSQMIGDCVDFIQAFNGKEQEALAVIEEIVSLHNGILDRLNHPDGKDNSKLIRNFYQQIKKDYIQGLNSAYEKLETLVK